MRVAGSVVVIHEVVQQHVVDRSSGIIHASVQNYIQCPDSSGGFNGSEDVPGGVAVHVEHGCNDHEVGLGGGEHYSCFHFRIPFPYCKAIYVCMYECMRRNYKQQIVL